MRKEGKAQTAGWWRCSRALRLGYVPFDWAVVGQQKKASIGGGHVVGVRAWKHGPMLCL